MRYNVHSQACQPHHVYRVFCFEACRRLALRSGGFRSPIIYSRRQLWTKNQEWRCRDDLPLHRHSFIFKFFCVASYLIKRANLLLGQPLFYSLRFQYNLLGSFQVAILQRGNSILCFEACTKVLRISIPYGNSNFCYR